MIKYVFFDFDGTISDAHGIAVESMIKVLKDYGYEFNQKILEKVLGSKMPVILKTLKIDVKHLQIMRKRFYKYFRQAALDGGIKPCVSLKPLWELKKEYPLIVVSNSETSFLRASVRKLKIRGLFRRIYGAEKFGTKDELLKKLFKKYKIRPSEAMYVGDRFSDVRYARKAGCIAVAINNSCAWSTLKVIKKEKPDHIVRDFRGLKKLLKEIK